MTLYVWPWRLLVPRTVRPPTPVGAVLRGPPSLDGATQTTDTAGGGLMVGSLIDIALRTPDQVRAAKAWARLLDGGVTACIVPWPTLWTAPRPYAGGRPQRPGAPPPADGYFDEVATLGAPMMAATADPADLRATEITITVERGETLRGGETFSIDHGGAVGWRIYDIARVVSTGDGASPPDNDVHTVSIRPPLRAAIGTSTPIELDVPRCQMRLDPERADDLVPELLHGKWGTVSAHFVEAF